MIEFTIRIEDRQVEEILTGLTEGIVDLVIDKVDDLQFDRKTEEAVAVLVNKIITKHKKEVLAGIAEAVEKHLDSETLGEMYFESDIAYEFELDQFLVEQTIELSEFKQLVDENGKPEYKRVTNLQQEAEELGYKLVKKGQ